MNAFKAIVLGFIAGAIAAVTVGEFVSWLFSNPSLWTGWDRLSWSKEPAEVAMLGIDVPRVFVTMFGGGLWGAIFGLILGARPEGPLTFRGAALGIVGPAIIGLFLIGPMIYREPPFYDADASKIIPVIVIMACFGAAAAWLYGAFRYKRLPG